MYLLKKLRMYLVARKMAKMWRKATGGSIRYHFSYSNGGYLAFSALEPDTPEKLAAVLREVADFLEMDPSRFKEVDWDENKRDTDGPQ